MADTVDSRGNGKDKSQAFDECDQALGDNVTIYYDDGSCQEMDFEDWLWGQDYD